MRPCAASSGKGENTDECLETRSSILGLAGVGSVYASTEHAEELRKPALSGVVVEKADDLKPI